MNKAVRKNVSYIEDLPELNDNDSYRRFIKPEHTVLPPESGMIMPQKINNTEIHVDSIHNKFIRPPSHSPSCLDIAEHVSVCPICIRFYKHDYTFYVILIAILSVVCLILLNKVLSK